MSSSDIRYHETPIAPAIKGDKISQMFYVCRVPLMQLRSINDIRTKGVALTGIKDMDEALKNEHVKVFLSIKAMSDLFKRGASIALVKPGDSKEIYDIIQEYLFQWSEKIRMGRNMGNAPTEDLIDLDKFAAAIYEHAKYSYNEAEPASEFEEYMNNLTSGLTNANFFTKKEYNEQAISKIRGKDSSEPINNTIPDRESYAERFADSVTGLRKWT